MAYPCLQDRELADLRDRLFSVGCSVRTTMAELQGLKGLLGDGADIVRDGVNCLNGAVAVLDDVAAVFDAVLVELSRPAPSPPSLRTLTFSGDWVQYFAEVAYSANTRPVGDRNPPPLHTAPRAVQQHVERMVVAVLPAFASAVNTLRADPEAIPPNTTQEQDE
jgi:hypothetical protein